MKAALRSEAGRWLSIGLRSLSEANALVVLGHDQGSVAAGEPVDVWLFEGLV